jgi:ParB-like chromosome segregation protein Spo0J
MSRLGEVLREERERLGFSQLDVAMACHIDRSQISNYERGIAQIPTNILGEAIRFMGSHRLRAQSCFECQINPLAMPYLDKVDMHPMTVITVLMEELQEAHDALSQLRLANKRSGDQLTDKDREAMEFAGEQVIDLLAAINTLLSGWHDWYGFDVDRQAVRGYEKLFERGYATRQSRRANSKVNVCV